MLAGMGVLRQLSYDECLRRLDASAVGRVAITEHALPAIVPVNYLRIDGNLVFRTDPNGMLAHGCDGTVVAFEIDEVDPAGSTGWSVLVVGTAQLLRGDDAAATGANLTSAVTAGRDQVVAVSLGQVTGREVVTQSSGSQTKDLGPGGMGSLSPNGSCMPAAS
jgi:nitroimidazol reductase NimA-like FMN-containing flavoprotein (pyridoxamine 5'-phosphate oxidase superfamily)